MRPPFVRVVPAEVELHGAAAAVILAHIRYRCESDGPDRVTIAGARWWRVSYGELGAEVGMSPSTIRRSLERLANVIEVAHHDPKEDQRRSYRIALDLPQSENDTPPTGENTNPTAQMTNPTPHRDESDSPPDESDSCTSYREAAEEKKDKQAARASIAELIDSVMAHRPEQFRKGAKQRAAAALDRNEPPDDVAETAHRLAERANARSPALFDHLLADVKRERAAGSRHTPAALPSSATAHRAPTVAENAPFGAPTAADTTVDALFGGICSTGVQHADVSPPRASHDDNVIDAEVVDNAAIEDRPPCVVDGCARAGSDEFNGMCGRCSARHRSRPTAHRPEEGQP